MKKIDEEVEKKRKHIGEAATVITTVVAANDHAQATPPPCNLMLPCLFPSCFSLASICIALIFLGQVRPSTLIWVRFGPLPE